MAFVRGFASTMSEVISFRLDKDKPRESRALRVLKRWQEEGHNTRYIVTEALLLLDDSNKNELKVVMLAELNEKLKHVSQIFNQMEYDRTTKLKPSCQPTSETKLTDGFIQGIKEAVKPGTKYK